MRVLFAVLVKGSNGSDHVMKIGMPVPEGTDLVDVDEVPIRRKIVHMLFATGRIVKAIERLQEVEE